MASNVCRTCMASGADDLHYLFYDIKIMEKTLPEVLAYVAELQIDINDGLPNYICGDCLNLAKTAFLFKNQCQRSDAAFKEVVSNCAFYSEDGSIKKELENELSNFNLYQNNIKEENEMQEKINAVSETNKQCNPYQCAFCNLRFSFCRLLEEHVKTSHNIFDETSSEEDKKFTCDKCHNQFNNEMTLLAHVPNCSEEKKEEHKNYESLCASFEDDFKNDDSETDSSSDEMTLSKIFKTEPEVVLVTSDNANEGNSEGLENNSGKRSKRSHKKKSNGIHNKKEKRLKKKLVKYLKGDSDEIKTEKEEKFLTIATPFSCTQCERKFTKELALNSHLKKHQEQMNTIYSCDKCKRQFQRKGHLDNHLLTHATELGFTCTVCSKSFAKQESLTIHLSSHKSIKKHQCTFCKKGFNVLSTLKDHIRTHTGEKPFLCSICGKGFSQSTNLKEHIRRHQGYKPFKCTVCEQTFVSKGELEAHTRKHSGAHPFVCDVCGGGFTTSSSLVKHRRIHTGERPYQCEFCDVKFTALGTLKNHRRRHTGEKPYKCGYCDKAFAQKNDLVSHTRTHTGERPYVCTLCGHAFRQSSALKTHLKTHGSLSDEMKLDRKTALMKHEPQIPLLMDTMHTMQLVTNLIEGKDCHEAVATMHILAPKDESCH